ncbi:MAG: hypothetical protein KER_00589 [Kerstersia gyiorum]
MIPAARYRRRRPVSGSSPIQDCSTAMFASLLPLLQDMSSSILALGAKHSNWLACISFVLALLKSLPFVALVIPGTALLLSIGALLGAGDIPFIPIWLAISLGAGLGDWISYSLGHRYGPVILNSRWIQCRQALYVRTKRFFDRWDWASIVLCRFFGPLRATVPLVAGIFKMPQQRFHVANWLSAFLWTCTLLLPGWAGFKLL